MKTWQEQGEAAFPMPESIHNTIQFGMSLRDYFAGLAMQGGITTSGAPYMGPDKDCAESIAKMAYEIADAMLEARKA